MKRGNLGRHRRQLREGLSTRGHHWTKNCSRKRPRFKQKPNPLSFVCSASLSPRQGDTWSPTPSSCHLVQPLNPPQFLTCPIPVTIPVSLHSFLSRFLFLLKTCPGFAARVVLCCRAKAHTGTLTGTLSPGAGGKVPPHPCGLELYTPPCRPCTCFGEIQGENTPSRLLHVFVMCGHTEQTKIPLTESIPVPPAVFPACKSQFIQAPDGFCWAAPPLQALQDRQKYFGSNRSPNSSSRWWLNPGKLGYSKV